MPSNKPTYDIIVKGNNLRLTDGYLGMTNLTLIKSNDGYILVDVGHTVNRQGLIRGLKERGLTPKDIRRREQISKYKLHLLDGVGEFQSDIRYVPAPGHTPGCYALILDTADKGRVVVAQDAIKFPKEALNARVDHAFDTPERATQTIKMLLPLADRLIPGHFMEMYREDGSFTWDDTMEFPIVIR